ncbi:MAG: adenylate/guanylate cyclase domain-containing protein [Lysobacterales bacterium]
MTGDLYARYLPNLVVNRLLSADQCNASSQTLNCGVMFADISGFTALTEQLTHQQGNGAEHLTRILNAYFTPLIELVHRHGGDVLKFAGDALIAIWQLDEDTDDHSLPAWRASHCGLEIQRVLSNHEVEGVALTLRVAVGTGEMTVAHLGGELNRWEFIISGKPLDEVGRVSDQIAPGDVGICPRTQAALTAIDEVNPATTKLPEIGYRLSELGSAPALTKTVFLPSRNVNVDRLERYIPGAIVHRLKAGHDEYLAELRRITVLFVNLPDLHYFASVEQAQTVMVALQRSCYAFEGSINKLSVDDKGVSLLAAFGLPPLAHSDDPERGVRCALKIREALSDLGWTCSIGITTGRVYCGAVGSEHRREYTIMGDPVNLAARLMQNADSHILCDEPTRTACPEQLQFAPPFEVALKGKGLPVTVSKPFAAARRPDAAETMQIIVGRQTEMAIVHKRLRALVEQRRKSLFFIEAPSGLGKTLLFKSLESHIAEQSVLMLCAQGDQVERQSSYFSWQQVIESLVEDQDLWQQWLEESARSALAPGVGLLNDIVTLDLASSTFADNLSGESRAEKLKDVVLSLLMKACGDRPLVMLVDDGHWLDSASLSLLQWVWERHPCVMLGVAIRPTQAPQGNVTTLMAQADEIIHLKPLTAIQTRELVANTLAVKQVPDQAIELIESRTEGHPYFSQQMAYALRDSGMLKVTAGGLCMLSEDFGPDIDLPHSIEGVITARLDRLTPQQSMTAKVASIVGRQFSLTMIAAIYPGSESQQAVAQHLDHLTDLELTESEYALSPGAYAFRQIMTQQVAYDLMPNNLKAKLHGALAAWLEQHHQDLKHHGALLAHHFDRAGDKPKTLKFLRYAAQEAQDAFANAEAEQFILRALEVGGQGEISNAQLGSWMLRLGSVQRNMGRLEDAQKTLEGAVEKLGYPLPKSQFGRALSLVRAVAIQFWRSYRPPVAHRTATHKKKQRQLEAAECLELLNIIYYWSGDTPLMLLACLRGANLAGNSGGVSRVLIRLYANLGLITSVIPLKRAPHYYCVIAERLARNLDHPPTISWVLLLTATHSAGIGRWEQSVQKYEEGRALAKLSGDDRQWSAMTASINIVNLLKANHTQALSEYEALKAVGENSNDRQSIGWAAGGKARVYFRLGDMERMAECTHRAEQMLDACTVANQLDVFSQLALIALHRDDNTSALKHLKKCVSLLHRPTQITLYAPCTQMAFAGLEYARRCPGTEANTIVRSTLRFAKGFARIFPVGRPALLFFQGLNHYRCSDPTAAAGCWHDAIDAANHHGMPYEVSLAGHALAVVEDIKPAERQPIELALEYLQLSQPGFPFKMENEQDKR